MAARTFRSPERGVWSAGAFAVGDIVTHSSKRYICKTARSSSDTSNPATDTTNWIEIPNAAATVSTFWDIHQLSWDDLKATIEKWSIEWVQGYKTFANIANASQMNAAIGRTKVLLLSYAIWVARHQNGNDRTPELDVHPQLLGFGYEYDQLLKRMSFTPLNPKQTS